MVPVMKSPGSTRSSVSPSQTQDRPYTPHHLEVEQVLVVDLVGLQHRAVQRGVDQPGCLAHPASQTIHDRLVLYVRDHDATLPEQAEPSPSLQWRRRDGVPIAV